MKQAPSVIYQSGQQVTTPGVYEVVGAERANCPYECHTREFGPGDIFPAFQGRAVCWHLVRVIAISNSPDENLVPKGPEIHNPWN